MNVNYIYLVLGKTCFHLGPLDLAMILLQTGKSIARAVFRCKSASWSDHVFPECNILLSDDTISKPPTTKPSGSPQTECEIVSHYFVTLKLQRQNFIFSVRQFHILFEGFEIVWLFVALKRCCCRTVCYNIQEAVVRPRCGLVAKSSSDEAFFGLENNHCMVQ